MNLPYIRRNWGRMCSVLERVSGLQFNVDFFAGYSPGRINPATKNIGWKILKITSGSTPETGRQVDALYQSVITAGTHWHHR
jgi:UDP-N-acetyl-D-galactosamine dehydrogenase